MNSSTFLLNDAQAWQPAGEGISRQIMGYNAEMMMVKVAFEPGAVGYEHTHPHTQATYVASGLFEATVDGTTMRLGPGDGFYAAPNIRHGVVCLEAGILIDTFAPAREDFLPSEQE